MILVLQRPDRSAGLPMAEIASLGDDQTAAWALESPEPSSGSWARPPQSPPFLRGKMEKKCRATAPGILAQP